MTSLRQRVGLLYGIVLVVILVSGALYMAGMWWLEGEPRGFWHSVQFASETITTTGYGGDSTWTHPLMVVFVVVLQLLGVTLIYMVVPLFLIPALEERFEARLPKTVDDGVRDHVLIYRYGPAVESLLEELRGAGVPAMVLEQDEAMARDLLGDGEPVIFDVSVGDLLRGARLEKARALVANGSDEENAALILTARQMGFEGDLLALVQDPSHRKPLELAGATASFTPRHMLAATLAARASHRISPRLSGLQQVGRHLLLTEVRIDPRSRVVGRTLAEADVGRRTGTTVIGQWVGGKLESLPGSEMRLEPKGILVAVGSQDALERLAEMVGDEEALERSGPFVVCGYGEAGKKLVELLRRVGEEVKVVDRRDEEGVTLAGDVLDAEILDQIDVSAARAVVLALDSDSATLFATVLLRDRSSEVPIIARVNEAANVDRIHRAGADFALSISQVAGQILAHRLLGIDSVTIEPQLEVYASTATPSPAATPKSSACAGAPAAPSSPSSAATR